MDVYSENRLAEIRDPLLLASPDYDYGDDDEEPKKKRKKRRKGVVTVTGLLGEDEDVLGLGGGGPVGGLGGLAGGGIRPPLGGPSSSAASNDIEVALPVTTGGNVGVRQRRARPTSSSTIAPRRSAQKNKAASSSSYHRHPRLTREEEAEISRSVRAVMSAMRTRDSLPDPTATESEWAKACGLTVSELRSVLTEGRSARARLVDANGGLVMGMARRHHAALRIATEAGGGVGTILTVQDMVQEGNLGLMEAAERFEPERGFRFGTYATYWVRQRILRSIADHSRVIRLPGHGAFSLPFSAQAGGAIVLLMCR